MKIPWLITRARSAVSIDHILRNQLLWMLALRIILYTLLLAISYIFQSAAFDIVLIPQDLLVLFLLFVYLTTIFSAFYLLVYQGSLARFGFAQNLLDTSFVSLFVFFSGSSSSIFTSVYFFPIVAGGLILPPKGGLLAAATGTFQYGILLFLEIHGFYPEYLRPYLFFSTTTPMVVLNHFAVQGLTFFLAAILSALFGTRLQKTESALTASIRKFDQLAILYKQIFDNISTGIVTIDSSNRITSANNAIGKIIGINVTTLIGLRLQDIFPKIDLSAENRRMTTEFKTAKGATLTIGYSHMPILESNNKAKSSDKTRHKIVTLQDISEIEKLEKQVRQAEKLAAIGMMSASIAHDFRNPLTAISGSAQVLANELASAGTKNYQNFELTHIIIRESNRLIETISDFLKFSRPEHANCKWFSFRGCLKEVLEVCQADPTWPDSCQINFQFKDNLDIWADEGQMFTVFNHLIQNSLSFCPSGSERITIQAEEIHLSPNQDAIKIMVSDNGSGIIEKKKEQVFEPFYTTRTDGTGLGLAIVKQTIEEHHGTISAHDGDNGGTLFIITLPLP